MSIFKQCVTLPEITEHLASAHHPLPHFKSACAHAFHHLSSTLIFMQQTCILATECFIGTDFQAQT